MFCILHRSIFIKLDSSFSISAEIQFALNYAGLAIWNMAAAVVKNTSEQKSLLEKGLRATFLHWGNILAAKADFFFFFFLLVLPFGW